MIFLEKKIAKKKNDSMSNWIWLDFLWCARNMSEDNLREMFTKVMGILVDLGLTSLLVAIQ